MLHPANGQIHSGQLIRFSAPSALGKPVAVGTGAVATVPLSHVVLEGHTDAKKTVYVVCILLLPDEDSNPEELVVTFGEASGKTLRTKDPVMLQG